MKILVFGAGVLGCNLARNFFRAGKDITLLARGAWGESIQKNGLRIKVKFSPRMSVSRIPVVTELKAEDKYDVIFVVLRYTQFDAILDAVSAGDDLPEVLKWKDSYLSLDSFVLVLGESYTGPVTVNLAHIPHILLGGSTGSGKSVLLKLLLMQALRKGAEVYIADFKGGVDFSKVWHEKCRMCFAEEDLCNILDQLVEELERRKSAFKALGCPNIDAYNEIAERPLQRLIFACDEVAEMLDKTGADSERKKLLAQIENRLSTIAPARAGVRHTPYSCHAETGRNNHPRPDTQQHGFPGLRQSGQRAFSNHSRQHQRRRTDTQGRARPLHHRGWRSVSRLSVRRRAALDWGRLCGKKKEAQ